MILLDRLTRDSARVALLFGRNLSVSSLRSAGALALALSAGRSMIWAM